MVRQTVKRPRDSIGNRRRSARELALLYKKMSDQCGPQLAGRLLSLLEETNQPLGLESFLERPNPSGLKTKRLSYLVSTGKRCKTCKKEFKPTHNSQVECGGCRYSKLSRAGAEGGKAKAIGRRPRR